MGEAAKRWIDSSVISIVTTSSFLQILGILWLCQKEERDSHNQDFILEPTWSINSG